MIRRINKDGVSSFKRALEILSSLLLVAAVIFTAYVMINTARGHAVSIFGNYTLKVVTGSMEPTIMTGDFIIVHKAQPSELGVNDIITFYSDDPETKDLLITHRIIGIKEDGTYITKGDANNIEDHVAARPERVLGKYVRKARYLGLISSFADTRKLILLLVIIPMLVISIFEVKSLAAVWKKVRQNAGSELTEEQIRQQEIDRIKKLAVEEYMKKENEKETEELEATEVVEEEVKESDGEEERDS